jgi:hypothetical protein
MIEEGAGSAGLQTGIFEGKSFLCSNGPHHDAAEDAGLKTSAPSGESTTRHLPAASSRHRLAQ